MLKKLPGRSSRSKGIKVKHILQIVLLVGVCFWLVYQVKRSHDKKKGFDQKDNEIMIRTRDGGDVLKFGRKELHPHVEEVHPDSKQEEDEEEDSKHEVEEGREELKNEAVDEEEDSKHEVEEGHEELKNEAVDEEEDSKHEVEEGHEELKKESVDEEDEGSKHEDEEETDDDGRGGGDDDMNENDREKSNNESDHEGDNADDERLKEDGDEEAGGDENSSDEQENDSGDRITHEAREENYKGDDASSAVAHDDHSTTSTDDVNLESSSENSELNNEEQNSESSETKAIRGSSRLTEEVDKIANNETSMNENFSGVKLSENTSLPTDGSVQDSIPTAQSNDQPESSNSTSSATTDTSNVENADSSQQKGTEIDLNHTRNEIINSLAAKNETSLQSILTNMNDKVLENSTSESQPNGVEGETRNITSKPDLTVSDDKTSEMKKDYTTNEPENVLPSMIPEENSEATQNDKSEDDVESNDDSSNSTNHIEDPVQDDAFDSNDSHVTERVDLDTLPDIEVDNREETAAE